MVEIKPNQMIKVQRNQRVAFTLLSLSAAFTVLILFAIIFYIMAQGLSVIRLYCLSRHWGY